MKQNILLAVFLAAALLGGWFARGLVKRSPALTPARPDTPPPAVAVPPPPADAILQTTIAVTEQAAPLEDLKGLTEEELLEKVELAKKSGDQQAIREARKAQREARHERHRAVRKRQREEAMLEREAARKQREETLKRFPDPNRPTGPLVPRPQLNPRILDDSGAVIDDGTGTKR